MTHDIKGQVTTIAAAGVHSLSLKARALGALNLHVKSLATLKLQRR